MVTPRWEGREGDTERKRNKVRWRSPRDSLLSPSCVPDAMGSLVRHLVITTYYPQRGPRALVQIGNG